jgi:hypothetical protein
MERHEVWRSEMMVGNANGVDVIVKALDPTRREIAEQLRTLVRRTIPQCSEVLKWGSPIFVYEGKNLACLMIYDDHVNLGFFVGAKLRSKRLEGTGKGLRHIKVFRTGDIDEREFGRLLKEAARLVS